MPLLMLVFVSSMNFFWEYQKCLWGYLQIISLQLRLFLVDSQLSFLLEFSSRFM